MRQSFSHTVAAVNTKDILPKVTFRVHPEQKAKLKSFCVTHNITHQNFFRVVIDHAESVLSLTNWLEEKNEENIHSD